MFLPDRFIKGECPKCGAEDQYGDNCEVLRRRLRADRAEEPVLGRLRRQAGAAQLPSTTSSSSPTRAAKPSCAAARSESGRCRPEAANKMQEWLGAEGENKLTDWDISRDAPYFGFEIPDAPGKYFYVWLDAPIGYMGSFRNLCARNGLDFDEWFRAGFDHRAVPLHRQGHPLLPRAVLAGRTGARRLPHADQDLRARLPDGQRREDVQVARHLHHRRELPRHRPQPGVAALLLRRQAVGERWRTSTSTSTISSPASIPTWSASTSTSPAAAPASSPSASPANWRRPMATCRRSAPSATAAPAHRRALRGARIRQGDARDHGCSPTSPTSTSTASNRGNSPSRKGGTANCTRRAPTRSTCSACSPCCSSPSCPASRRRARSSSTSPR